MKTCIGCYPRCRIHPRACRRAVTTDARTPTGSRFSSALCRCGSAAIEAAARRKRSMFAASDCCQLSRCASNKMPATRGLLDLPPRHHHDRKRQPQHRGRNPEQQRQSRSEQHQRGTAGRLGRRGDRLAPATAASTAGHAEHPAAMGRCDNRSRQNNADHRPAQQGRRRQHQSGLHTSAAARSATCRRTQDRSPDPTPHARQDCPHAEPATIKTFASTAKAIPRRNRDVQSHPCSDRAHQQSGAPDSEGHEQVLPHQLPGAEREIGKHDGHNTNAASHLGPLALCAAEWIRCPSPNLTCPRSAGKQHTHLAASIGAGLSPLQ